MKKMMKLMLVVLTTLCIITSITACQGLTMIYGVTLPEQTVGYTLTGNAEAPQGKPYEFTFALLEGYEKAEDFAIKVNGEVLTADENGKVTVADVQSDLVVTVEGVKRIESAVTLVQGEGYTLTGETGVLYGEDYTFNFAFAEGYKAGANFAVKVNGEAIKLADGKGIVTAVKSAIEVTVEGVEKIAYGVTLVQGEGYTLTGAENVLHGEDYVVTIAFAEGYKAGENFAVKVNGEVVVVTDGVATVSTVKGAIEVTVEGVELKTYEVSFVDELNAENKVVLTLTHGVTITEDQLNAAIQALTENDVRARTFANWDKEISVVKGEISYIASFNWVKTDLESQLYSIDDAVINLASIEGEFENIVDANGNEIACTFAEGVATVTGDNFGEATKATGKTVKVTVFTTTKVYVLPLKVYTDVIESAEEFDEMKKFIANAKYNDKYNGQDPNNAYYDKIKLIQGYYILANDIDFASFGEYDSPFGWLDFNKTSPLESLNAQGANPFGWCATFDGNGHQIKNLCVKGTESTYDQSLFGFVSQKGGVIKNVAFVNCSLASGLKRSAFIASTFNGTLENVYLDIALLGDEYYNSALVGRCPEQYNSGLSFQHLGGIKNVTVNVRSTFDSSAAKPNYVLCANQEVLTKAGKITNLVIIGGKAENRVVYNSATKAPWSTIAEVQALNSSIVIEISALNAANNANLTACGNASFAVSEGFYNIKWNDEVVYSADLAIALDDELLYSIDDAVIDLSTIEEIEASKVTAVTRAGVEVAFQISGNQLVVSGDDILNGVATEATGEKVEVVVLVGAIKYSLTLRVYTDVIESAEEFDEMKKFITNARYNDTYNGLDENNAYYGKVKAILGYYILANDIDFASFGEYDSPFGWLDFNKTSPMQPLNGQGSTPFGWSATFDGNGYQIKNLCVKGTESTYDQSLFGFVSQHGGVIKNVAFVNCSLASGLKRSAFIASTFNGTLENVYLDIALLGDEYYNSALVGRCTEQYNSGLSFQYLGGIKNVTVNVRSTFDSSAAKPNYVLCANQEVLTKAGKITNLVIIGGGAENRVVYNSATKAPWSTVAEVKALNGGITIGTNAFDAVKAGAVGSFGSTSFSASNGKFAIAWNDKEVYSGECAVKNSFGLNGIKVLEETNGNVTYTFPTGMAKNTGIRVDKEMPEAGTIEYTLTYKKHSSATYFELLFFVAGDNLALSGAKPSTDSLIRITFRPNNADIYIGESVGPATVGRIKPTDAANAFATLIANTADGADITLNIKVVYAKGLFEFYINDLLYVEYGSENTAIYDAATKGNASFNAVIDGLTGTGFGFSTYNTDPTIMPEIAITNVKVTSATAE